MSNVSGNPTVKEALAIVNANEVVLPLKLPDISSNILNAPDLSGLFLYMALVTPRQIPRLIQGMGHQQEPHLIIVQKQVP